MKEKSSNVWSFLSTLMVLAVVFAILAMLFAAMIIVFKPLASQWIDMSMKVASTVSTEPAKAEPTKAPEPTESTITEAEIKPTVEPTEPAKATEPGELEHFSCSWLNNCTTTIVPANAFAITFKKVGSLDRADCTWTKLSAEETIDYTVIDEFLVYSENSIPEGVTLEDFVAQEAKTVWACQPHSTTAIENRDTYYPQFSCSDMSKCTVTTVPAGTFTIGYIPITTITAGNFPESFHHEKRDCTTIVWSQGQEIQFEGVGEIHTYDIDLPMTSLELFILSQKPFVASCH